MKTLQVDKILSQSPRQYWRKKALKKTKKKTKTLGKQVQCAPFMLHLLLTLLKVTQNWWLQKGQNRWPKRANRRPILRSFLRLLSWQSSACFLDVPFGLVFCFGFSLCDFTLVNEFWLLFVWFHFGQWIYLLLKFFEMMLLHANSNPMYIIWSYIKIWKKLTNILGHSLMTLNCKFLQKNCVISA